MFSKKTKITTLISIIVVLFIGAWIHHHDKKSAPENAVPPIPVTVASPLQKTVQNTTTATGYLVAANSTALLPDAAGYIRAIGFQEGQSVKKGQMLFQLDSQAEKDAVTADQASENLTQLQVNQDEKLLKKGFITKNNVYSARAALKQNEANLQTAQTNLKNRTIAAPFDGVVGSLPVSIGDYVLPTTTLTTVTDTLHLHVKYTLPVKNLNQIHLGEAVQISNSSDTSRTTASISYIAPLVNQTTQTLSVHAQFKNTANQFKPGEYVSVTQPIGKSIKALLVPEQSVMASISGYSVFIAKNNKAIRATVTIGQHINGNTVITSGLKSTDQVIIAGQDQLKNNQAVLVTNKPKQKTSKK